MKNLLKITIIVLSFNSGNINAQNVGAQQGIVSAVKLAKSGGELGAMISIVANVTERTQITFERLLR